jgi:hypothetical protein
MVMPSPTIAIPSAISLLGARSQSNATQAAADTQAGAQLAGIDEQRRQFNQIQELMKPFVTGGQNAFGQMSGYAEPGLGALEQQLTFAGLRGGDAQNQAIQGIANSPEMLSMLQQGENAMLQNASATGGLRGGNLQGAMAQFRPQLLNSLLDKQYARLGGIAGLGLQTLQNQAQMGQASAANQASAGMQSAGNIAQLLSNQGAAQASGQLAQGRFGQNAWNTLGQAYGMYQGMQKPNTGVASTAGDGFTTNPFGGV